nr:putative mitochondrial chaperone bcs1-b [Quercus suber]
MDFRRLSKAMPVMGGNMTAPESFNLTEMSPNLLEALIPGYSILSKPVAAYLGIDISIFVTVGAILFAVAKGGQYLCSWLEQAFRRAFISSVYIDEHDDLFDMIMAWLAAHQTSTSRSRTMRAKTQRGSGADDAYDAAADDAVDENGLFNFNKWSARTPPRYEPYYGRQFIWHEGRVFWFRRARRPNEGQRLQVSFGSGVPEDDIIQLDCIGSNIDPIKDLLRSIRAWSLNRTRFSTTIRHPTPKDRARYMGAWSRTTSRPSRPMDTVILDMEQKNMIINDMNEYLHPASTKWYATRGIPYRRGYLFHGPPGTGKTSLSFALAGIFGLEIYAISLQEPTLTEGELMQLFNGLPRRCIVLLEDVDAAGLVRDGSSDQGGEGKKKRKDKKAGASDASKTTDGQQDKEKATSSKPDDEYTLKDLAKELKALSAAGGGGGGGSSGSRPRNAASNNKNNKSNNAGGGDGANTGISLSGLLNAIDGVATHEGRVLIMTSNHPEKLDPALVRPGRVDRKIGFRLAMKTQIRELFVRMYEVDAEHGALQPSGSTEARMHALTTTKKQHPGPGPAKSPYLVGAETDELADLSRAELEALAVAFAAEVADDTFTPAEIQGLLMRGETSGKAFAPLALLENTVRMVRDRIARHMTGFAWDVWTCMMITSDDEQEISELCAPKALAFFNDLG